LGRPKFDATIRTVVFLRLDVKKIVLGVDEDTGSRMIRESIQFLDKLSIYKTRRSPILSMEIYLRIQCVPAFQALEIVLIAVWRVVLNSSSQILALFKKSSFIRRTELLIEPNCFIHNFQSAMIFPKNNPTPACLQQALAICFIMIVQLNNLKLCLGIL
jgi:hypothetical protein